MKKLLALILSGITVLGMSMITSAADSKCKCTSGGPNCQCMVLLESRTENGITMNLYGHPDDCKCGASGPILYKMVLEDPASESAALEQESTGIPWPVAIAANAENKSVGEYMNNAVTSTPELSQTTPVAQGGNVIIDGMISNQTFSVKKVLPAHVNSIKAQAASIGGTVLNCVDIDGSVFFDTANVNFYMPGVVSGQNIQVYHLINGTWCPLNVTEIREDHVIVDMTSYGIIAFVEVPAETSVEAEAPAEAEIPVETPAEAEASIEAVAEVPAE